MTELPCPRLNLWFFLFCFLDRNNCSFEHSNPTELIVRLFKTLWHIYWEFEIIVSSFSVLFYSYRGSPSLFWTYYFPPLFPVLTPEIWICGKVNMNRKNKREMLKCWTLYVFDYFLGGELKLLCSSLSALASEVWMWRKPEHMAIHRTFRFFRLHGATRPRQEHKSKTSLRNRGLTRPSMSSITAWQQMLGSEIYLSKFGCI